MVLWNTFRGEIASSTKGFDIYVNIDFVFLNTCPGVWQLVRDERQMYYIMQLDQKVYHNTIT